MFKTLKQQYKDTNVEIEKLEVQILKRREIMLKLEGALEALEALEPDDPEPAKPVADHTEAAKVLGVFN